MSGPLAVSLRRQQLIARVREGFRMAYGVDPTRFYAAPGRVNLIGDHTDYNAGLVLPCAIDRETIIAVGPADESDKVSRIHTVALDMGSVRDSFSIEGEIERAGNNWQNHIRGVAHFLRARGVGLKPARLAIGGDIPMGAGLSSSAALGVGSALALSSLAGQPLDPPDLASVAQKAESAFAGVACGIMDQMASACSIAGHAFLLDCRSLEHMPIPISDQLSIIVIDSGIRRQLEETGYNDRREECEKAAEHYGLASLRPLTPALLEEGRGDLSDVIYRRARHVVSETARVEPTAVALVKGQTAELARLMRASHHSLRDDFEVSIDPIDRLVSLIGTAIGDNGGVRMTGGGFGGSVVVLAKHEMIDIVTQVVETRYNPDAEIPASVQVYEAHAGAAQLTAG